MEWKICNQIVKVEGLAPSPCDYDNTMNNEN